MTLIRRAAGLDRKTRDVHEYEEALLLSYTVDFGFLDAVAVAPLRSTGARVTAVGDVTMANFDPRSAPRAGREFNAAYAQSSGAFHPKLFVLASPSQARIAIGSGNATMAGWSYNHELWTVITCASDQGSPLAAQLADWLEALPAAVRFSAGVDNRLMSVAGLLRQANGSSLESASSIRLVSSLTMPIIDQLPRGPVDELRVFAPFFDPGANALTQLIERFQPASIEVSVQPGLSQFDGAAILSAIGDRHGRVLDATDDRYRHGKLVEWRRDGRRWALTGSANISAAAMLRTQVGGGNCELGVISEITESLMPDGASEMASDQIRSITAPLRTQDATSGPLLLGAHRGDNEVQIALTSAFTDAVLVQYMAFDGDQWADLTVARVDERTLRTSEPLLAGSRIRLRISLAGTISFSNIVTVTELATTTARRVPGSGSSAPKYALETLFSPALLERLLGDLQDLGRDLKSLGVNSSRSAAARRDANDEPIDGGAEIEAFESKIGLPILAFSIGAALETNNDAEAEGQLEDEDLEDGEYSGVEEEQDPSTATHSEETDPIEVISRNTTQTCARYRRWAQKSVDRMLTLTATGRLAVTRIVLWLMAAGIWESDDDAACLTLIRAVRALGNAAVPTELESSAGSLAAIGVTLLKRKIPTQRGTREALEFTTAVADVAYLLVAADVNTVDNYLRYLVDPTAVEFLGLSMEAEQVMDVAAQVLARDEVGDAMGLLIDEGFDVSRPSPRVLRVHTKSSRPELVALQALSYVETAEATAAWCTTPAGKWSLILWRKPDFVVINSNGEKPPLWSHFQTHLDLKVIRQGERTGSAGDRRFSMATEVRYGAKIVPIELGVHMLAELGLDDPHPPRA